MNGTSGARRETVAKTNRNPRVTFPVKWLAMRTWISTDAGVTSLAMARSGCRLQSQRAGHPITTGIGPGSLPGAGRGWTTHRGDSLLITMAVGLPLETAGAGYRDHMAL